jgi:uncharacterized Ntn-hydrolase superfamily protein
VRRGTYSIVALDPRSGQIGAAAQSHWFAVGSIVPWAEPGVGAVATQAIAEPAYGPRALALLRDGVDADEALGRLLRADPQAEMRQVAVLDADGGVAAHTGTGCVEYAGHREGEGYACQATMMAHSTVPDAMTEAFERAPGALAPRMLAALEAAEAEGGDMRGRQSAALVLVEPGDEPWRRAIDLRVDDDPEPLRQLGRLLGLHHAYELAARADELLAEGRYAEAAPLYDRASQLAPSSDELLFWAGLGLAQAGDVSGGADRVRAAVERGGGQWEELLARLPPDLAPAAAAVREALRAPPP